MKATQPSNDGARPASPSAAAGHAKPPWHGAPTAIARRFHQLCAATTSDVVGEFGLTPLQYGGLVYLSRQTGSPGIEQNNLADRLNVDRNTASLLVEQLARKGLVARQVNGADRRVRQLSLTPKGEELYARLRPAFVAANEKILAPIAVRERKLLIDLLIRVIEGNMTGERRGVRRRARRARQGSSAKD